ncbi:hypothetical protein [Noviherbaspirillum aerium]|uniref:hypothetical protein n=1 Tax=Noviherbaspirillum aerium TaxID=2588497 RepID=UPI00124D2514|nr:hypothetical protein [Noviherbaspirillum aerium]
MNSQRYPLIHMHDMEQYNIGSRLRTMTSGFFDVCNTPSIMQTFRAFPQNKALPIGGSGLAPHRAAVSATSINYCHQ